MAQAVATAPSGAQGHFRALEGEMIQRPAHQNRYEPVPLFSARLDNATDTELMSANIFPVPFANVFVSVSWFGKPSAKRGFARRHPN